MSKVFVATLAQAWQLLAKMSFRFDATFLFGLLGFAFLAGASNCYAAPPISNQSWGAWDEARALYDSGKLDEALHELTSHPALDSAAYSYNVGTVLYRMGKVGMAVAYLEKADHLQPHDPEILQNLRLSRDALGRLIGADRLDPSSTWAEALADPISLDEVRAMLGLLGLILSLLWIRKYLKTRSLQKTLLSASSLLGLLAFAATLSIYGVQRIAETHPPAFCLDRQVLRSGPADSFLELSAVEAGVKLRLLGPTATQGNELWRQVRYSQDGIGWVRDSQLLLL